MKACQLFESNGHPTIHKMLEDFDNWEAINNGDEKGDSHRAMATVKREDLQNIWPGLRESIMALVGVSTDRWGRDYRILRTYAGDQRKGPERDQEIHTDLSNSDLLQDAMRYGYAPISFVAGTFVGSRIKVFSRQPSMNRFLKQAEIADMVAAGVGINDVSLYPKFTSHVLFFRPNCVHAGAGLLGPYEMDDYRLFGRFFHTSWHFNGNLPIIYSPQKFDDVFYRVGQRVIMAPLAGEKKKHKNKDGFSLDELAIVDSEGTPVEHL